jgi:glycine C-acetyltransferase/8-amino-7-oxononanoate synthase
MASIPSDNQHETRAFLSKALQLLQRAGLKRKLRHMGGAAGPRARVDGREAVVLCSNNYLGLATEERVQRAAQQAIEQYGTGASGSRLISGNLEPYGLLESELAAFKGTEAALVFTSGYQANVGAITALVGANDALFSDELNHASIIDGARLSRADTLTYRHCDAGDLENKLRSRAGARRRLIVTESVFSMDGDIAPLEEIVELGARYGALVMVDEAHATGVLGAKGAGVVEQLGLSQRVDVQMGTFSKALGSLGGYLAGSRELIAFLLHRARTLVFTTGLPPGVVAASREALRIVRDEPRWREALWHNVARLRNGLEGQGYSLGPTKSQILPVVLKEDRRTMAACRFLLRHGVFVQGIRPPTVPAGTARLRISPMATHTDQDLDEALAAFEDLQSLLRAPKRTASRGAARQAALAGQ